MQKIGFIDWLEGKLSLYIFEKKDIQYILADTLSVPLDGELSQSSLTSIVKTDIKYTYLSVPPNLLSVRELSFPFSDKNKIKDTIPYELEGILLGNVSNYSIDYFIKESSETETQVLAMCMEKTKLRHIIDTFSSAGLDPVAITCIDLRLSTNNIEKLFEESSSEEEIRTEAAREELVNLSINLRQDELAYKGDIERIKKSIRLTGVLIFILLLILGADTTLRLLSLKKENVLVTKEINRTYHSAFPEDTKIVDALRQFKGNLNSLKGKKAILGGIPTLDILLNIANHKNRDITLNEFTADGENIIIKGTALSFENVDAFKNVLSPLFTKVKVIDSRASPDKKITFSIVMKSTGLKEKT